MRHVVFLLCVGVASAAFGRAFESNCGQLPDDVRYGWRAAGTIVHFKDATFNVGTIGFRFVRGNPSPDIDPLDPQLERRNFLHANHRTTDVPTFGQIAYRSIYPGIDAVFHGTPLEVDFLVAPHADVKRIALDIDGADHIALAPDGSLRITANDRVLSLRKPIAWQGQTSVSVRYAIRKRHVRLLVGAYDRSRPLIIDPVLEWSTYFGPSNTEGVHAVTTGADGSVYIGGVTSINGISDAFVSKLTPSGDALLFTTYLGGRSADAVWDLAIDASGLYVTGSTQSPDFPVTPGAFDEDFNDPDLSDRRTNDDMFVTKMSLDGSQLLYSSYLGGTGNDGIVHAIAVDGGFAYVSGRTGSLDFPTTDGAFDPSFNGPLTSDVFITKFNTDGTDAIYSTFLGGSNNDYVFSGGLAVDALGNLYVAGITNSQDFPRTAGVVGSPPGSLDHFVTKFDSNGQLLFCATFGGSDNDGGNDVSIALDGDGSLLIAGEIGSPDWPVVGPSQAFAGEIDLAVTKLDSSASSVIFSRIIGGAAEDSLRGAVLGDDGFFYLTGQTKSFDFPLTADALDTFTGPDPDEPDEPYLVRLNAATGDVDYSSYFGGSGFDTGTSIAYAGDSKVIIVGATVATDFAVTPGALETSPKRSFVSQFSFGGSSGDGVVGASGGSVTDSAATGAVFTVPAGVLSGDVAVTIDVLPDPGTSPPPGFSAFGTFFVSFVLQPNPSPLPSPGATITLPLDSTLAEGTVLDLFKYDPDSETYFDTGIDGTVNAGGATATFAGVTSFSVFVAFVRAYEFVGFGPPIANDGTSVFKSGRVVPIKFRLSPVTNLTAALRVFHGAQEVTPRSAGNANVGNAFRFDAASGEYTYNLDTSGYAAGVWLVQVAISDGSFHEVRFSIRE